MLCACAGRVHTRAPAATATVHTRAAAATATCDVTLYRDLAWIRQTVELDVPAGASRATVQLAGGVTLDQVRVLDHGALATTTLRAIAAGDAAPAAPAPYAPTSTQLALDVTAARAGHYTITLGYPTDRLRWDAAYTLTTNAAHDRAQLTGALAIRNATGIALPHARARVIDADLATARTRNAGDLAARLVGGIADTSPAALPRELGTLALPQGEARIALADGESQAMRAVFVFDAIGTALDTGGASPLREPAYGTTAPQAPVAESFEIVRDPIATAGLPGGRARLVERRTDGSLATLGETTLFDPASRAATVDNVYIGPATHVRARRERRELTIDDEAGRLVEEFAITLDNDRDVPIAVIVREHMYRGLNWHLAYPYSRADVVLEGEQQIAMRRVIRSRAHAQFSYVVVYTWQP
jgi:hypothetical protein